MNAVIEKMREERRLRQTRIKQKGTAVYATFTKDERTLVQFGMFPHDKMLQADKELANDFFVVEGREPDVEEKRELSKDLAVAIMDAANAGPDKMVV